MLFFEVKKSTSLTEGKEGRTWKERRRMVDNNDMRFFSSIIGDVLYTIKCENIGKKKNFFLSFLVKVKRFNLY